MLEVGQTVVVVTDKGTSYAGFILARASGSGNTAAYKVAMEGGGLSQTGQWHKEADVFVPEPVPEKAQDLPETLG